MKGTLPSRMLRRAVRYNFNGVSEKCATYLFRVKGRNKIVACLSCSSTMKTETVRHPQVRFLVRAKDFSFHQSVLNASGANQLPSQSERRTLSLGSEADLSPPPTAEVKNTWIYTPTPPYVLTVPCLIKHRNNLRFYIYASPQCL
jgi:hypothetical protein